MSYLNWPMREILLRFKTILMVSNLFFLHIPKKKYFF